MICRQWDEGVMITAELNNDNLDRSGCLERLDVCIGICNSIMRIIGRDIIPNDLQENIF